MSKNSVETVSHNVIAAGTEIVGDISSEGNIRIDGIIKGNLVCKGKVVLGEAGKIEGEVSCINANISGEIQAKITVTELLSLNAKAKLHGEINAGKLAVEPGAVFTGACNMGTVVKGMQAQENQTIKQAQTA